MHKVNLGPLTLLVLQPTSFCNIDCSYCYLPNRHLKNVVSDDVLAWALRRAFSSGPVGEKIDILWHAGEPLIVGTDFYWNASRKIAEFNVNSVRVSQCLQTNGTLIDAQWGDLFKSCDVKVGVSLDGPEWINDMHRRTRANRGTFHATMRGINALRTAGIGFSILAVLTRESLRHIDDVFNFFEAEGIHNVAFNLEEIEGANTAWSFEGDDDPVELYRDFARKAFVRHSRGSLAIREMSAIEGRLGRLPASIVGPSKPLQFVTVDVDGGFSTYCPELHGIKYPDGTRHVFGNVRTNDFLDIIANPQFLQVYDEVMEGVAKCARSCNRFAICGSHRVGNKFFENGTFSSSETVNCRTRIKVAADVIEAQKNCAVSSASNAAAERGADTSPHSVS
jgi:uncharacterized protein